MKKINVGQVKGMFLLKRPGASSVTWSGPSMRKKTSLKIATIPEDMLELLGQNFRLRKLLKDYLAQLLIFEVTGPENQVSTSKIRMSGLRGRKLEFLVSALPLMFCFFRFFLCLTAERFWCPAVYMYSVFSTWILVLLFSHSTQELLLHL